MTAGRDNSERPEEAQKCTEAALEAASAGVATLLTLVKQGEAGAKDWEARRTHEGLQIHDVEGSPLEKLIRALLEGQDREHASLKMFVCLTVNACCNLARAPAMHQMHCICHHASRMDSVAE